ncbi:MAG: helix-turn-helix domain-containing protein [Alphaproteobacteria bacterium]
MEQINRISNSFADNSPDPIDIYVGKRLRLRRNILGLSQEQLAKNIGISFQQIQKYEHGTNRISASRLYDISRVLKVPISFFFDDIKNDAELSNQKDCALTLINSNSLNPLDPMDKSETLELVNYYWKISNTASRTKILELVKALSCTTG